jgi:DNA-binding NarL/FixJ family response regulator
MREDAAVTVLVGRFDPVIAVGLESVLRDDPRLTVREGGPGYADLVRAAARWAPQVAILDERAERRVRQHLDSAQPATGILVFAHEPTLRYGTMMLAAGATCLARNASPAEIRATVHLVAQGGRMFRSADGQRIKRCYPEGSPPLTPREIEVLARLSEGKPHKQTAQELRIGLRTVHTYTSQICRKLGVRSKRDLIGMPVPGPQSEFL